MPSASASINASNCQSGLEPKWLRMMLMVTMMMITMMFFSVQHHS